MQRDETLKLEGMGDVQQPGQQLVKMGARQARKGDTGNERPKGLLHMVRGNQQAVSLGGGDAAQSQELQDDPAMIVHSDLYKMRTRTLFPSVLTRTSVPGSAHESAQKEAMVRQGLMRPARQTARITRKISGDSRIAGIQRRKSGSHALIVPQWGIAT